MNSDKLTLVETKYHSIDIDFNLQTNKKLQVNESSSIEDFLSINDLKLIVESFYELTQLGVGIFSSNHTSLINIGWQKICTDFHQNHPKASKSCKESEKYFRNNFTKNKALSYKCKNGLWDIAYPFYINNQYIGSIYFGQFFYTTDTIDKSFFKEQAEKFDFDTDQYINYLKNVPILAEDKVISAIRLLINVISKLC